MGWLALPVLGLMLARTQTRLEAARHARDRREPTTSLRYKTARNTITGCRKTPAPSAMVEDKSPNHRGS